MRHLGYTTVVKHQRCDPKPKTPSILLEVQTNKQTKTNKQTHREEEEERSER